MDQPMLTSAWKPFYAAATLESDGEQLRTRIETANIVMQARLKELQHNSCMRSEKAELQSALSYLRRVAACLPRRSKL